MQKSLFLAPAAVIIFILYFTVFGDRGLLRINHLHRDLDDMQKHLTELKDENDKLKREIAALQSDRRYLESIARRDFGLVRGNEVVYQFPGGKGGGAAAAEPAPAPAAQQPAVAAPADSKEGPHAAPATPAAAPKAKTGK